MPATPSVPVTVLTGFLGSGKTTLLNRILTTDHGERVAVIVNEFGEIGIDQQLVVRSDEEIFEMNNGCICCTVRGDLIRIIGNLMRRRHKFDRIAIETTGLADPGPVIQTFFLDEDVRDKTKLDAVVTVVDAKHIQQHWGDREAQEQIAFADVILLNKIDLVSPDDLDDLEERMRRINPMARIYRTQLTQPEGVPVGQLLDVGGFDLSRILERNPAFLTEEELHEHGHEHPHHGEDEEEHHHHDRPSAHDSNITSVAIAEDRPVNPQRFHDWLGELLRVYGPDIFRMKGILAFAGEPDRFVFQGVHMVFDGQRDRPWQPDEVRRSQLVLIGRHLDREQLTAGFRACLV